MDEHITNPTPVALGYDNEPPSIPCGHSQLTDMNTENQGPDNSEFSVNDEHVEETPDDCCNHSDIPVTGDAERDVREYDRLH